MRDRGKAFEAPDWWLEIARAKVGETKGLIELGKKLAKVVGRSAPWSHTVLSKFASAGAAPTQELAIAISVHFQIPRPFYVPADLHEARAIQAVADMRALAPTKFSDPVRSAREKEHIEQLDRLEGEVKRHSERLDSRDAEVGRARSRGSRGVHRGG